MRRCVVSVPAAAWRVSVIVMDGCADAEEVAEELADMGCLGEDLAEATEELHRCGLNTGIAYTNGLTRCSLIVIGRADSPKEFANTLFHELHHVVMHICECRAIDPRCEDSASLAGEVGADVTAAMIEAGLL